MNIIEAVSQEQQRRELNDTALARLLEIHPSIWSRIKSGKRKPSPIFLSAILQHLPELKEAVVEYMKEVE